MKVSYENQDCDEEYQVCWEGDEENSFLFDTEAAARACVANFELAQDGTTYYIYLLTTYYDALGDKGLTESKLIYRTGETQEDE